MGDQIGQGGFLIGQLCFNGAAPGGIVQLFLLGSVQGVKIAGDLVLVRRQIAGLILHLTQLPGKLTGTLLAHVLAQVLEVLLGAGAGSQRFRDRLALHLLGGPLHVVAGLIQLLTGLGLLRRIG